MKSQRDNIEKCLSDKGLVSKIHKELLTLKIKEKTNPIKDGQMIWTDISPRGSTDGNRHMKVTHHHMSLGNCKLKQWDTTAALWEWLKPNNLIIPDAGKEVTQQGLSYIAGGKAQQYSHFVKEFGSFLQR